MKTVVGVFANYWAADCAAAHLLRNGVDAEHMNILSARADTESLPMSDTEQSGTGAAIGGVIGAAIGAAGALPLATVTAVIPGIGPVFAAGLMAATLLGLGGAVAGAAAGKALEEHLATGISTDEVELYQSALRQGRSVVVVFVDTDAQAENAHTILQAFGAESIDPAGHDPWIGLREPHYEGK